ncbi:hypothetical protein SYNPS1DRAFT_26452 [Syncephalis pseudoplumigaleata]|uniref:Copper transport protein n=1 Tax=Syncephalis pseudoplumigaleata TaxID=1712513 RepID=A0A4P9Z5M2_9FUNG|nr:hypothetical protein SYNPS1DRAFT_26452 [Syncephalis pseudoplumigaleata]|eukprot:RKP27923.1 hypothetical protein SYNPS1DRAFT_26452 [Syncephalis pseudoplumigaleata]
MCVHVLVAVVAVVAVVGGGGGSGATPAAFIVDALFAATKSQPSSTSQLLSAYPPVYTCQLIPKELAASHIEPATMNMGEIRRSMDDDAGAQRAELRLLMMTLPMASVLQQVLSYFVVVFICLSERAATCMLERYPYRYPTHRRQILVRTGLYSVSTLLRYIIMLAVMSFLPGVFVAVILSLSIGQLFVEALRANMVGRSSDMAPLASPLDYRKVMPGMHPSHDEDC